jgi:hypothetical protein
VGDTVGDPFKDTSGPSLNILIKLMSMASVVFAGLITFFGNGAGLVCHVVWRLIGAPAGPASLDKREEGTAVYGRPLSFLFIYPQKRAVRGIIVAND